MAIFVIGGTGFIGIRVIPLLVALGESVVCMDINPNAPSLAGLGEKVSVVRGDVTQFDDVISVMEASKADRVINLSYNLGQDLPPHRATKLNIVGMDNCFEAARILGIRHIVFASSLAVNGQQITLANVRSPRTTTSTPWSNTARTRRSTNSRPRTILINMV